MRAKQLFYLLAFCFISSFATAQKSAAYLKAGVNFANVSYNSNGEVDDASMLTSFHVGIIGDWTIAKVFGIQTGLLFTGKGSKLQSGSPNDLTYYKATTNPLYIELPVNAVLKFPLSSDDESAFFVGAGPYIAIGIAGKHKIEGKYAGVAFSSKDNIEFSNDDPTTFNNEEGAGLGVMKRFDYGLNGTAGFQFKGGLIGVNYGYGLAKLQSGSGSSDDNKNKHRVLSITLGIKL